MHRNLTTDEKHCENCQRPLFGRTDKRFCNDTCRNNFNRNKSQKKLQQTNESIPEIFRIIKRNYEILKEHGPNDAEEGVFMEKGKPEDYGINTKFFTSIYTEIDIQWRFCFDYGWNIFENGGWEISYRPDQAELK